MLLALSAGSRADEIDPLHGMVCPTSSTCAQTDNGNFSPIGNGTGFTFAISPDSQGPAVGDLTLAILVPTNTINVTTFNLPGLLDNSTSITENVFSRVSLFTNTSADLPVYLGLAGSFSPTDNFANASVGEGIENPGFSGSFLAFTATLSGITLNGVNSTIAPNDFKFGSNLPAGTVIVGLFHETSGQQAGNFIGTAASGDLVITPAAVVPGPIAGAGLPGILTACLGLWGLNKRRRNRQAV
jgi:hypothetical protein